jgi:guanine deaminase
MTEDELMARAVALSEEGLRRDSGGPFGALVARDSEVVAEGWNRVTSSLDPTAHAEIEAIRAASRELGSFDLSGCVLFTSCEPCPMCLAASYWARLDQVYYANTRVDAASIGFDDEFFYQQMELPAAERSLPVTRLRSDASLAAFESWARSETKIEY